MQSLARNREIFDDEEQKKKRKIERDNETKSTGIKINKEKE